jgi:hypothetical protein
MGSEAPSRAGAGEPGRGAKRLIQRRFFSRKPARSRGSREF